MRRIQIPSVPNPDRSQAFDYEARKGRPMLFQVVEPGSLNPLYSTFLALHMNPSSIEEKMQKSSSTAQTRGGWIEWNWPDELGSILCESTTGAFFSPESGLTSGNERRAISPSGQSGTSAGRKGTIAWERREDFLELFRSNGNVFDSEGRIAIRGRLMCIYDRGVFIGHFSTFEETEDDSHPYSFQLVWEFKIEKVIYKIPQATGDSGGSFAIDPETGNE